MSTHGLPACRIACGTHEFTAVDVLMHFPTRDFLESRARGLSDLELLCRVLLDLNPKSITVKIRNELPLDRFSDTRE